MKKSHKHGPRWQALFLAFLPAIALLFGCGGKTGGRDETSYDVYIEEALVRVMSEDGKISQEIQGAISESIADSTRFQETLNFLIKATDKIFSLIDTLSQAGKSSNRSLQQARESALELLRERVHQIESSLNANSPQELAQTWAEREAELNSLRDRVLERIREYNPALIKRIRQRTTP